MSVRDKIYFASDLHLGAPNYSESRVRECRFISWLDSIESDAKEIYILGDIFDFWFEYKHVVPKGFLRLFSKLLDLKKKGIGITILRGNHDMWMFDYFEHELGIPVYDQVIEREFDGKKILIGHGDGLGPGDTLFKIARKIFVNKACRRLFSWLHPDIGIGLANRWSKRSRAGHKEDDQKFLGKEKEFLVQYCLGELEKKHYDYFLFFFRHLPIDYKLKNDSRYINTGDWIQYFSYAVLSAGEMELRYFK